MNTFTIITNGTSAETIKNSVIINPLNRTAGFMPVFEVNAISNKLTEADCGYYAMYNSMDASDCRIVGFEYNNEIYFGLTHSLLWGLIPHTNSAKNGGSRCLRFQPTAKTKKALVEVGAVKRLCSRAEMNLIITAYCYNYGQAFEKLLYMMYNKEYKPNNIPFYIKGDLEIDSIQYNIKFFKGTLTIPKIK